jgi:D-alanyl-D-alanine-carboxypeptidase/D-alanyl-D-alanine-endopeptidase
MAAEASPLMEEVVGFTGQLMFIEFGVPGLIIAAVRGDESAVFGFGETAKGSDVEPDGRSVMQIGSVTKVFVGEVLARLLADHIVGLSDPLADYLHLGVRLPSVDGRDIRLIDLVTQSAGVPREVTPDGDPVTIQTFARWFKNNDLLYKPGSAVLYSNFGFELLGLGLEDAAGHPLAGLVEDFITEPLSMSDTTYVPSAAQRKRMMQGYNFDGKPFPDDGPEPPAARGASGLYTTADDIVRWIRWHLDRFAAEDAEVRLLDHAAYLQRDGLTMAAGMDESGHMDAIGLGWVVMMPEGDRPFILQKAGGTNGFFAYLALAPTRDVGAFVVINEYDFSAAVAMAETINGIIAMLAPR